MIREFHGSIFDSGASVLVNPVNCAGVMGKGLAKQFKRRYPEVFEEYSMECDAGEIYPGHCTLYIDRKTHQWIAHFPTKRHWRDKSRLEDIVLGLVSLREQIRCIVETTNVLRDENNWSVYPLEPRITSVAFPMLGCGLGGLDWSDVRPLIEQHFDHGLRFVRQHWKEITDVAPKRFEVEYECAKGIDTILCIPKEK